MKYKIVFPNGIEMEDETTEEQDEEMRKKIFEMTMNGELGT